MHYRHKDVPKQFGNPKPEKILKVKKKYVYKRKPTGEKELFLSIWNTRKHFCTNCGVSLGKEPKVGYFSHIKGKGAYPELRLEESNISLLCLICHQAYDQGTREQFNKRAKNDSI